MKTGPSKEIWGKARARRKGGGGSGEPVRRSRGCAGRGRRGCGGLGEGEERENKERGVEAGHEADGPGAGQIAEQRISFFVFPGLH